MEELNIYPIVQLKVRVTGVEEITKLLFSL